MRRRPYKCSVREALDYWSIPEPNSGCTLWLGAVGGDGYGVVRYNDVQNRAHRLAWIDANGPVAPGLVVRHKCDNPLCINVDHLCVGTVRDNNVDRVTRKRGSVGERHYKAKLTDEAVRAIRKDTRPLAEIAAEYGVTPSNICAARIGRTWKHV